MQGRRKSCGAISDSTANASFPNQAQSGVKSVRGACRRGTRAQTALSFLADGLLSRREDIMSPHTIFLGKLIGLYCIIAALCGITHKAVVVQMVATIFHDPGLIFALGVIVSLAGLAMILAHNIWSGGALAVVVTLIGWATLIKGLLFLFLSPGAEEQLLFVALQYNRLFYLYMAISLVIGIYLTYAGFKSKSKV
jgi:hypothetical protein